MGLILVLTAVGGHYFWKNFLKPAPVAQLPFEEAAPRPAKDLPPPQRLPPRPETPDKPALEIPKIAIVIDDLGYDRSIAQEFIELPVPLTLSFLPQAPYAREMAVLARERGKETLLHLPMEPLNYPPPPPQSNPGPGALLLSMSENEIKKITEDNFREFPFCYRCK